MWNHITLPIPVGKFGQLAGVDNPYKMFIQKTSGKHLRPLILENQVLPEKYKY